MLIGARRKRWLVGGALLLLIAGASVYFALFWGRSLSFFTIAQDEAGNWDYRPGDPALMIIATPREVDEAAVTLQTSRDPKIIEQMRNVDYNHDFVVLVLYGLARSGGYSIPFNRFKGETQL